MLPIPGVHQPNIWLTRSTNRRVSEIADAKRLVAEHLEYYAVCVRHSEVSEQDRRDAAGKIVDSVLALVRTQP
jgi:hypothetical protein